MAEIRVQKIEIRVSESEKAQIKSIAESASLDVSTLIRSAVLTDKKLIFLNGGAELAKEISRLITELQRAVRTGVIDNKYCPVILSTLENSVSTFNQLMDMIPDISEDID